MHGGLRAGHREPATFGPVVMLAPDHALTPGEVTCNFFSAIEMYRANNQTNPANFYSMSLACREWLSSACWLWCLAASSIAAVGHRRQGPAWAIPLRAQPALHATLTMPGSPPCAACRLVRQRL